MKKRLTVLATILTLALCLLAIPAFAGPPQPCGDNVTWSLESGVLTIRGSGEMETHPWTSQADAVLSVVIGEGVTEICPDAFAGCGNLTEITIPSSMECIGGGAFTGCDITTVNYNGIWVDWDDLVFSGESLGDLRRGQITFNGREEVDAGADYPVTVGGVYTHGTTEPLAASNGIYDVPIHQPVDIAFSAPQMDGYTLSYRVNSGTEWWSFVQADANGAGLYDDETIIGMDENGNQTITIMAVYTPNSGTGAVKISEAEIPFHAVSQGPLAVQVSAPARYDLPENPGESDGYSWTVTLPEGITAKEVYIWVSRLGDEENEIPYTRNGDNFTILQSNLADDTIYSIYVSVTAIGYDWFYDNIVFAVGYPQPDITIGAGGAYYMTEDSDGYVIMPVIPEALQDVPVAYWELSIRDIDNNWTEIYSNQYTGEGDVYPGSFTVPKNLLQAGNRYSYDLTIQLEGYTSSYFDGQFITLEPVGENPGIAITLTDTMGNSVTNPMVNETYIITMDGGENLNAMRTYTGWWRTMSDGSWLHPFQFVFRTEADSVVYAAYGSTDGGNTWSMYNAREFRFTSLGTVEAPDIALDKTNPVYERGETVKVTAGRKNLSAEYQLSVMLEVPEGYNTVYSESVSTDDGGQGPVVFRIPTAHLGAGRYQVTVTNFMTGYKSAMSDEIYFTITETGTPAAAIQVDPETPVSGGNYTVYAYVPGAAKLQVVIKRNGDTFYDDTEYISEWTKYFKMTFGSAMSGSYQVFVYADDATAPAASTTFEISSKGKINDVAFIQGYPTEILIGEALTFSFTRVDDAEEYEIDVFKGNEYVTGLTVLQPANNDTITVTIPGTTFTSEGSYNLGVASYKSGYDNGWSGFNFQVRNNTPWRWRIEDGKTLILSGEGEIPDFESADATPWTHAGINRVIVEKDITGLGKNVLGGFSGTVRVDFMQKTRPALDAAVLGGGSAVFRFFGDEDDYTAAELTAWTAAGVTGATWTRLPFQPTDSIWLNFSRDYTDQGTRTYWKAAGPGCPYPNGMEVTAAEAKELTFDRRWVYLFTLPAGDDLAVFSAMDVPTKVQFSGSLNNPEDVNKAFTLTAGTAGMLEYVDVMMNKLELTVQLPEGGTLPEMKVRNATSVTVNGNIGELELTNTHDDDPAAVTVNGNIAELSWYSPDAGNELFRGSLALKGTIAHMTVYGKNGFHVPGISADENDKVLFDNLACTTYTNIVRNGTAPAAVIAFDPETGENGTSSLALTAAELEAGEPVAEMSMDQFRFDYTFRENNVVSFTVRPKEDSGASGKEAYISNIREKNPGFTADDMLRGGDVTVYVTRTGAGENDPVITLNPDAEGNGFDNVYLEECKAVVNCPVEGTLAVWQFVSSNGPADVTINNSVEQLVLVMNRGGGEVRLGMNGLIRGGYCTRGIRGLRNFGLVRGARTLAEDGQLTFLTAKDGQRTKSLPATDSVVTAAAGTQLAENETASMDINDSSEQSLTPAESTALAGFIAAAEADPDNPLPNLTVESVIDISIQTYTQGETELTPGTTLSTLGSEVPIRIGNDTGKEMIVVRLHDEEGDMTATPLLTSGADVLDFKSDLFSKYALVSIGWETDNNWSDWEFAQVNNEYVKGEWTLRINGSGAIPAYGNAHQAPWSSAVSGKENVRIIIGAGVTGIGKNAFGDMRGTVRVDFEGAAMPAVDADAFAGTNAICRYYSTDSSWTTGTAGRTDAEWIYLPKYEREYPGVAGLDYIQQEGETEAYWAWDGNRLTLRQAEEMSYTHLTFWMNDAIPSAEDATLYTARNVPWRLYAETWAEGTMTLDADHGGTTLELLQMSAPNLTLTVDHSRASTPMIWVTASDGKLNYTGNTYELILRGSFEENGEVTFRGNIGDLTFYNGTSNVEYDDGSVSINAYLGDLKVVGTIARGSEYGRSGMDIPGIGNGILLPGGGTVRSFTDMKLTEADGKLVEAGVFQRTDIPTVSTSIDDYWLEYMFRDQAEFDDYDGVFLVLHPRGSGQDITIDVLANKPTFTTQDIIWGSDTEISVHCWDPTPNMPLDLVLDGGTDAEGNKVGFRQLFTNSTYGTITVNCPIYALEVAQAEERGDAVAITVNSTVSGHAYLRMRGNGSVIDLGENGEVHDVTLEQYLKNTRYVAAAYGAGTLYADGRLCVLSAKQGESLQSILPGDSQLSGANDGKTTVMEISEKEGLDNDETAAVEDALKAAEEVATVFDVSVTEYAADGSSTACHELNSSVQMAVENTTGGEAYVARLHEDENGQLVVTPVSETSSSKQIWFTSDLFSTYVVISTGGGINPATLDTLWLPDGLTRIEDEAFAGGAFEAVVIPDSCTYVGHGAFAGCPNLIYISYMNGTTVENDAFRSDLEPVVRGQD